MVVLTARNLSLSFGALEVLRDVSLVLTRGERMGLVGANGSGKTTLLRLLSGELTPEGGSVQLLRGLRVGYAAQFVRRDGEKTVLCEMQDVFAHLSAMEERMRALEKEMGDPSKAADFPALAREYDRLSERFRAADGYAVPSRILGVLAGIGFDAQRQRQPVSSLSGGELTRLNLARLLLEAPDLLLLDEPTNYLDLDALAWLEEYLLGFPGSMVVVSHDRYFLDRVCTGVTEILHGVSESYRGNYSAYLAQRAERFDARERSYRLQQKEIERQRAIIERFRSFNREKSVRAAESREKALARMETVERPRHSRKTAFHFSAARRSGDDVLTVSGLGKAFDGRQVFENLDLTLKAGERAALIGANGIGKSTLLKCVAGLLEPDAGAVRLGAGVDLGYYDQKLQQFNDDNTVADELQQRFPRLGQGEIRGILARFLFVGEEVFARVGSLSGGERARLALAGLMLAGNNLLLLDEPTSHLDADSREALEEALYGFEGTILAVSHDRYFINRFAQRILIMSPQGLSSHEGDYDDYLRAAAQEAEATGEEEAGKTRTEAVRERRRERARQERLNGLAAAVTAAEKKAEDTQAALRALEARLAEPSLYEDPRAAAEAARLRLQLLQRFEADCLAWDEAERRLTEAQREP